jgi:hypothetical protein
MTPNRKLLLALPECRKRATAKWATSALLQGQCSAMVEISRLFFMQGVENGGFNRW